MQQLKFTLELPPSINKLYRKSKFGVYMTAEGKAYKERMIEYVAMEALHQDWKKIENQYVYMDEIIYMNKKGRDADNTKKLTQDVITESNYVWTDDTYCLARTNRIYIDSENPKIEIVITPTDFMGVFNNQDEFKVFDDRCLRCSKCNKCAIKREVLENRIIPEVQLINGVWTCNKYKEPKIKKTKKSKK